MEMHTHEDESGYLLGFVSIAILLVLFAAALFSGISEAKPTPPGKGPIFMGLSLIALGVMFFASYFYSWKSFFFRWLLNFSTSFNSFGTKKMAFFFSALCIFCGVCAIGAGLGFRLS